MPEETRIKREDWDQFQRRIEREGASRIVWWHDDGDDGILVKTEPREPRMERRA